MPGGEAEDRVKQFGYTKGEMAASYFKPLYHISVTLNLLDYKQNVTFKVRSFSTHGYERFELTYVQSSAEKPLIVLFVS